MPHGGGHVGGGFHGGGGGFHHHHGGFHHHHHHRTHYGHHHHYYTPWLYGGGYYGYRRRPLGWGVGILIFLGVVIVLSISLSIHASFGSNYSSPGYAPTDTRLVSYSSTFCDGLTLSSDSAHSQSTGSMYLLSEKPQLDGNETFSIDEEIFLTSYGDYNNWNYYLHPGSSFKLSVCYNSDSSSFMSYVVLIKGKSNFNSWTDDADSSFSFHHFLLGSSYTCSSNSKRTYSLDISDDGEYYFVFYNEGYVGSDHLSVQIDFSRTKYTVPEGNSTVLKQCSIQLDGFSSCTVPAPYSPQRQALLVLDSTADPIQWDDNVDISVSCKSRAWPYVLISLSVVGFVALLIAGLITTVVCVKRHKKKKYAPLANAANPTATTTTTTATVTTATTEFDPKPPAEQPPPYNPTYGATTTPPAYTP